MICLNQFDQIMTVQRKIANVEGAIHLIRGQRVMLDSDLAAIYGVTTKRLNEQLQAGIVRVFQMTSRFSSQLRSSRT